MEIKENDEVVITNYRSIYFNQTGIVKEISPRGLYIEHTDGKTVFHPWGWQKVRHE